MSAELKYFGTIKDGRMKLFDGVESNDLADFVGEDIEFIIRKRKKRSLNQNGFYWSNFVPSQIEAFKERWGETYRKEQVHEWNKVNFWGEEKVIELTGECVMSPGSSANQSTIDFEKKLENIRQWFRQNFEWELPLPLQQEQIKY